VVAAGCISTRFRTSRPIYEGAFHISTLPPFGSVGAAGTVLKQHITKNLIVMKLASTQQTTKSNPLNINQSQTSLETKHKVNYMKTDLKPFTRQAVASAGMLLLMLSPSAFGGPAYWNGATSVSSDYSDLLNWNPAGTVPWDPTCDTIIINPGAFPCVIDNADQPNTPATSLIISVGGSLTITTNGLLNLPGSFNTGNFGASAPVYITGGTLFITNDLNLGNSGNRGDFIISAGTVTAGALSINNTAGTKMIISGTGAFITDISQLANVEYWVSHSDITGKDPGWSIVVDTNAIAGKIKITATGADFYTVTVTSQNSNFDPIDTSNDLLLGLLPAGYVSGATMGWEASYGVVDDLTDGQTSGGKPLISSGTVLTFALPNRSDITNMATYSYWPDGGRVNQAYIFSVSTNGGASFTTIQAVDAVPNLSGGPYNLQVLFTINGSIINVTHVRFSFPNTQNNGVGYTELVVQGTNSPALPDVAPGFATDLPPALGAGRQLPFALSVVPTGNPVPTCQWFKNNDPILGATLPILNFPRFAPSDVGTYFVTVTNSQGSTNSVSCVVTMTNQPSVLAFWDPYSQNASFDPLNLENDLLLGRIALGYSAGDPLNMFNYSGTVDNLTDGTTSYTDPNLLCMFPNGTVLTFLLPSASDITNVATYSSWADVNRVNQDYTFSVSTNGGVSFKDIVTVHAASSVSGSWPQLQVLISPNGAYIATNVTHVRFTFPTVQNGGVGYTELMVQGTPSPVELLAAPGFETNLPPTAQTGRQLPFSLSVTATGSPLPFLQWYKNDNPIVGANLPTLNIPRFAPSDVGTYFVTATNSQGSTNSVSCDVTMTNQPWVLAFWDPTTQHASFDPLNLENDLILGVIPLGFTSGQLLTQFGRSSPIDAATDGQFGPADPWTDPSGQPLWFQSNTAYTWALPSACDITNVATYSGWPDSGRVNQDYTLSVSKDGGATFQDIVTVNAVPSSTSSPIDLQVLITPNGTNTTRYVTHVRFTFGNVQNGAVGYTELVVQGTPSPFAAVSATRDFWQATAVTVLFDRSVSDATATNALNYTINQSATVSAVTMLNSNTVVLTTSPLAPSNSYVLTINNVQDLASNPIPENTQVAIDMPVNDTVRAQSSQGGMNLLVLEAEHYNQNTGAGGSAWSFTTWPPLLTPIDANTNYSATGAMLAIPNSGVNKGSPALGSVPAGTPRLDFKVQFTATGTNYVWVRGVGDSSPGLSQNDSVFIGLDGVLAAGRTAFPLGQGYAWSQANAGNSGPIVVNTPGLHVINVWMREDGFTIDKLLLSSDPVFNPGAGIGPAESAGPGITVTPSETGLVLTWVGGGILQSSTNVVGTYTDIIGSSSPWPITPTGVQNYYRVRQ
jgi:hypothetical protein